MEIFREYELIFILRPDVPEELKNKIKSRIEDLINKAEGRITLFEFWGKRKLAFEIQKQNKGLYHYYRFVAPPELVAEIERFLRLQEPVMRYLTVKLDDDVSKNARPPEEDVVEETEEKTEEATEEKAEEATEEKTEEATEEKTEEATEEKAETTESLEQTTTESDEVSETPAEAVEDVKQEDPEAGDDSDELDPKLAE